MIISERRRKICFYTHTTRSPVFKKINIHLKENFYFNELVVDTQQISSDRTIKTRFKLHYGELIEGVLIPSKTRIVAIGLLFHMLTDFTDCLWL